MNIKTDSLLNISWKMGLINFLCPIVALFFIDSILSKNEYRYTSTYLSEMYYYLPLSAILGIISAFMLKNISKFL
jgi:hypothetical protein